MVNESTDTVYVAIGNLINLYSLTTNLLIGTLRSKRQQASLPADKAKTTHGDVHKAQIIAMKQADERLVSLCSKGVLAEWDIRDQTLIDVFEL